MNKINNKYLVTFITSAFISCMIPYYAGRYEAVSSTMPVQASVQMDVFSSSDTLEAADESGSLNKEASKPKKNTVTGSALSL